MEPIPRLTSITGVSRALMATVGVEQTVDMLVAQFGWDVAVNAVARVDGPQGAAALWRAVQVLSCENDATAG